MRVGVLLAALVGAPLVAAAQPAPPPPAPAPTPDPAPQDPYANPPGKDPVLSEQIAEQLVSRAQELYDARVFVDAKQLAVEALVESPKGNAADRARFIIKNVNAQLGIHDEPAAGTTPPPPAPPPVVPPVDTRPIEDPTAPHPTQPVETPPVEPGVHDPKLAGMIHGGIFGATIGATIGSYFSSKSPAAGAVPMGLGVGAVGTLYLPKLFDKAKWDEAQVRTVGSASLWASGIGGLVAYAGMGANGGTITASGVLLGGSIGAVLGAGGGIFLARQHKLTRGDVALVDTLAGIGAAGGLAVGGLMQPAQKEAYAVNMVFGIAAGTVVGYIAAPQTNTTPRRMLRVAGVSAAGGALPLLILAAGPHKSGVQQAVGGLSTLGLLGGAWLGFYLTRHLDEGLDVPDRPRDDTPTGAPPPPPAFPVPPPPPVSSDASGRTTAVTLPVLAGTF